MSADSGSYTNTGGGQTARSSNFYAHSLLNVTDGGMDLGPEPGDPGTNLTLTLTKGVTEEDWRDGTSGFASANSSYSTNFTQHKTIWTELTFSEQSDQWNPTVPDQVGAGVWGDWNNIPNYFKPEHIVQAINPHGAPGSPPPEPATSPASSTASANYSSSDQTTFSGMNSWDSRAGASSSSTFIETDNIDQYAVRQAASPAGFNPSQPNAAGAFFSGTATYHETDDEEGWNRFGTAHLTYDDTSKESDSYSFFTATDTTPASGQPVYQHSDSRSMTSTTTDTGSYQTNPLGVIAPPTFDNPAGRYAYLNDHRTDNVSVTASVSQLEVASATSGSWARSYTGTASSSFTSDHTVLAVGGVGGLPGSDVQLGSYSLVANKGELSVIGGGGSMGSGGFGTSWTFLDYWKLGKSVADSGSYAGGGTQTVTTYSALGWRETDTVWGMDIGRPWSYTMTISSNSSGGGTTSGADGGSPPITVSPPDPPPYTLDTLLDDTQLVLTVVGFVPGWVGVGADLLNAAISYARGDNVGAAFNVASALVGSWLANSAKAVGKAGTQLVKNGDEAAKLVGKGINGIEDVGSAGRIIARNADEVGNLSKFKNLDPAIVAKFPACFFAGTSVSTELDQKPIEAVQQIDRVWAFNLRTGRWELCHVVETYENDYIGDAVDLNVADERIQSTYHHPYWVVEGVGLERRPRAEHIEDAWEPNASLPGRWVDAGDLLVGDVLLLRDGRRVPVEAVSIRQVATKVYNFQVADLHNYAVGRCGVLVHNNSMQTGAPGRLYDVGLAKNLGKNGLPFTQVHHVPGTSDAVSLVGTHQEAAKLLTGQKLGRAGREAAIRISQSEHIAINAAQKEATAAAGARDLLAQEIRFLRNLTDAPNSALKKLIQLNKDLHFEDYLKI